MPNSEGFDPAGDNPNSSSLAKTEEPGLVEARRVPSPFTVRAVIAGVLLSVVICVLAPYANCFAPPANAYLATDFSTEGAIFLFFLFVGIVNVFLGILGKRFAFTGPELATVYIMLIVAISIPTMGFTESALTIMTGAFYYATPENDWANLIQPYISDWIVPQSAEGVKYFYEGLPKGDPIPWGIWIRPLFYWCSFIIVLYFVMICMMVILRKQWMDREKLVYPLAQVPIEMIGEEDRPSIVSPFLKNGLMWMGFLIPFVIESINSLRFYISLVPRINLSTYIPIFRRTVMLPIRLELPMLGFSYLVNRDIAFGVWAFYLFALVQRGVFNILGIHSTEKLSIFGNPGYPYLAHQGMGGIIVYVLFGLWVARGHLWQVLRKAFKGDPSVDDSGELLSYRTAVFGTIAGMLLMGIWIWASGLPLLMVPILLGTAFILFLALTRLVAEGGIAMARAPMIASGFVVSGIGTPALGPRGLIALAFTYVWNADIRTFVMASCANGQKLIEGLTRRQRPLFWIMMLAILVSLATSVTVILYLGYTYGGINLNSWFFIGAPRAPFDYIQPKMINPTEVNWGGWGFTGIGGLVMILLMLARHRLLWWPLHPIGFMISGLGWITGYIWFSVFLAWLMKSVILKYGGPGLYRSSRPFFLGLILGGTTVTGVWVVVDWLIS